ncbi:MAG: iron-sulfur cluster insertion protein ErpA [Anaerolineae bacterium]|nr:MAG: iron-sulfur cluster insertion protein ErpA [Anaerolineae bacterium]
MAIAEVNVTALSLTETAANAVRDLLQKRNVPDHALRVFISGGGCSGYQYGMALEGEPRPTDLVIEQYGVRVVVDEVSLEYLRGASIDFVDDVMGSGFKIENPNATSACGCGNSFRTDGGPASEGGGCGHH